MSYIILIYFADLLLVKGRCNYQLYPLFYKEFVSIYNQLILFALIFSQYVNAIVLRFTAIIDPWNFNPINLFARCRFYNLFFNLLTWSWTHSHQSLWPLSHNLIVYFRRVGNWLYAIDNTKAWFATFWHWFVPFWTNPIDWQVIHALLV